MAKKPEEKKLFKRKQFKDVMAVNRELATLYWKWQNGLVKEKNLKVSLSILKLLIAGTTQKYYEKDVREVQKNIEKYEKIHGKN
jgi:hypothetical protein